MTPDAPLVRKLERALYATADRPGTGEVTLRDDWVQVTTASAPTAYRNRVLRSILSEADAPARIEATIEHYRARSLPFAWVLTPSSRPETLRRHLLDSGFEPQEVLEALVAEPEAFAPPSAARIEVVPVDAGLKEAALACQAAAWGAPPPAQARFRQEVELDLAQPDRGARYFLAYLDGRPAGTGSYLHLDGFAHFSGSAVLPACRRQGVYRELILARMADLRAQGVPLATNHCVSTTSAPICRDLGFRKVGAFEVLQWTPPA